MALTLLLVSEPVLAADWVHRTIKSIPNFSTGWTHSVSTPNGVIWYNATTGDGACGRVMPDGSHATVRSMPQAFSKGWTHVLKTRWGVLWYNAGTGAGALGRVTPDCSHETIASISDFSTGWTHIVETPSGILYYNAGTGQGAVGVFERR